MISSTRVERNKIRYQKGDVILNQYLEKWTSNQIQYPKAYEKLLHNLFFTVSGHADRPEMLIRVWNPANHNYSRVIREENLKGIEVHVEKENTLDYVYVVTIKTKTFLAQLDKYVVEKELVRHVA